MPKSSVLTIRIDPEVKSQADRVLQYLGMTTSEAVTIFLRQVILTGGIPFSIKAPALGGETIVAVACESKDITQNAPQPFKATVEEMSNGLGI